MGLSTEESWRLTPREFDALIKVFRDSKDEETRRWIQLRVDILNAPHFSRKDKRAYQPYDFFDTSEARTMRLQAERDRIDLMRAERQDALITSKTRDALKRKDRKGLEAIEEEYIPSWARMTPEEKAARGL